MSKRWKISFFTSVFLLLAFPSIAFAASYLERKAGDIVAHICTMVFKPIFDTMLTALAAVMLTPTNFDSVPFVMKVKFNLTIVAYSLLALNLAFRAWRFSSAHAMGGEKEPLSSILMKTFMSGILIIGLPEILKFILKINEVMILMLKSAGVNFDTGINMLVFPATGAPFVLLLCFCFFVIALVGLVVSNAIRWAELCTLFMLAPVMAVSHAGKGETFQIWVTQAIVVSLTQAFQFGVCGLALNFIVNIQQDEWWSWLAPIGGIVLSIKGPQWLKQFLYTSGVGGFATSSGQQVTMNAIYSKMMKPSKLAK